MIVVDTHVRVWLVADDARLGEAARGAISAAAANGGVLASAITTWEIAMLAQKGRLLLGRETGAWIGAAVALPGIGLAPIEPSITVDRVRLPGTLHPDPANRLIIATARHFGVRLLSADAAVLAYGETGHLKVTDARR